MSGWESRRRDAAYLALELRLLGRQAGDLVAPVFALLVHVHVLQVQLLVLHHLLLEVLSELLCPLAQSVVITQIFFHCRSGLAELALELRHVGVGRRHLG